MSKKYHSLVQGKNDWHQFRANHFTASEAPAMLGLSKYQSRDDLLKLKKTGISPEIDPATQRIFDLGHKYEALARPFAEEIIGGELFSPTISMEIDGLPLSASLDGEPLDGPIWEHKTLNKNLARDLPNGIIELMYAAQMEQQLLVSGGDKCLLMASKDGDRDSMVWCWYESDPELRKRIIAGWHQFKIDLDNYEAPEVVGQVVAEVIEGLPAVSVQVSGSIDIIDNFEVFGNALKLFIKDRLIISPETDQDFADLEEQIKTLKKAEDALEVAEAAMLAQVESVSTLKATKDTLHKLARDNRLMAEKLIKSKKEEIKAKIVTSAIQIVRDHVATLNDELAPVRLPEMPNNMAAAIKGKRSIDMMRSALNDEVASVKIQANDAATTIRANIKTLDDAGDYRFLFNDLQQVIMKAPDDFANLVGSRIAEHDKREADRIEADRQRIREEEQRKAEAEQRQKEKDAEKRPEPAREAVNPVDPKQTEATLINVEPRQEEVKAPELSPELVAWCKKYRVTKPARAALLEILSKQNGVAS